MIVPTSTRQPSSFSLDEKYTRHEGVVYLSGVEALVRLPLDQHRADRAQGLNTATFISGYPGSPLGTYDMELLRHGRLLREHQIVFRPGLNEDLAATAVFGSQMAGTLPGARYDGVLGIWFGKAPGLDRSGDALKHANYAGVGKNGGVLALVGDDPIGKSSTLPNHSEVAFLDALIPVLYPGTVQEVLDLGLHGFNLSRAAGLWTGVKMSSNICDETSTIEVSPERVRPVIPTVELDGRPFAPKLNISFLPPHHREMERNLHYARLELARRYAYENRLNRIAVPTSNAWLGILTTGKSYYDVRQALTELGLEESELHHYGIRILQMGLLFPVEPRIIQEFARGLEEIVVVEEKRAFLELFAKEALYGTPEQPRIVGKNDELGGPLLPINGELDSDSIARALARRLSRRVDLPSIRYRVEYLDRLGSQLPKAEVVRLPYLCSGCPHNRSSVVPEGSLAAAGIGCHSMLVWMDRIDLNFVQMGGEGAQWVGISPFTENQHLFQNLGDGTLFHSGSLAINFAVAAGVNVTYKILYNSAVAMTGGQDATGVLPIPALSQRLLAEGVKRVVVTTDDPERYRGVALPASVEVWHRDKILDVERELKATPGVTVLIHDQQCAAEKRRLRKRGKQVDPTTRVFINERVCEGCGDCGKKSNCLSVQPVETEFGRKTQIHQSSCNKDYSCLLGDCPSFLTIEPATEGAKPERRFRPVPVELPEPVQKVRADGFSAHLMGIGGTGVVTVNRILGTAALLDGKQVRGLDQIGLSQKAGPVVSHLKIFEPGQEVAAASRVSTGEADLFLAFDLIVATDPANLAKAHPDRSIAVVSTSQVPTGHMVANPALAFPKVSRLRERVDAVTRKSDSVHFDAEALAEELFGDHLASNMLALGAAYQAGALPVSGEAIEAAIQLNGVAVEMNQLAFSWGRLAVVDPKLVDLEVWRASKTGEPTVAPESTVGHDLLAGSRAEGELRRLLDVRVLELIAYQDERYARTYLQFVERVREVEARRLPGSTRISEAVARNLFKLMAYKDEYEVARLHLDPKIEAQLRKEFGKDAKLRWHLHPPMLRTLGMESKLELGEWFRPTLQALAAGKLLRGTPLDPFGYAEVRRVERALISEYRDLVKTALKRLRPETAVVVLEIVELPDLIRGYEQIKLDNVATFRERKAELLRTLGD